MNLSVINDRNYILGSMSGQAVVTFEMNSMVDYHLDVCSSLGYHCKGHIWNGIKIRIGAVNFRKSLGEPGELTIEFQSEA